MNATLKCPNCGTESSTVYVEAPATVVSIQRVGVEIDIAADLAVKEYGGVKRSPAWSVRLERYLVDPRVDRLIEVLDPQVDVHTLELDYVDNHGTPDVYAYCAECNGDVSEQFRSLLDERVPLEVLTHA